MGKKSESLIFIMTIMLLGLSLGLLINPPTVKAGFDWCTEYWVDYEGDGVCEYDYPSNCAIIRPCYKI
jgi:hypothetical protein